MFGIGGAGRHPFRQRLRSIESGVSAGLLWCEAKFHGRDRAGRLHNGQIHRATEASDGISEGNLSQLFCI
jgi:hypothetical protein